jgi:ferredoxin-type protein NapH
MSPFMITGMKIRNLLNIPALQLKNEKNKCIKCKICEEKCPMSLPVSSMVEKNNMDSYECILCGNCIDSCKNKVIKYHFGRKTK